MSPITEIMLKNFPVYNSV